MRTAPRFESPRVDLGDRPNWWESGVVAIAHAEGRALLLNVVRMSWVWESPYVRTESLKTSFHKSDSQSNYRDHRDRSEWVCWARAPRR